MDEQIDAELNALVQRALDSLKAREGEDVGEWAARLAADAMAEPCGCGYTFCEDNRPTNGGEKE